MKLPDYAPPPALSACVAVALAPLLVLLAFCAVVWQLIEVDSAMALLAVCTVWVVVEMVAYQRAMDAYNADYAHTHLSWRSPATLAVLAGQEGVPEATRDFVLAYVHNGRRLPQDAPRAL